MEGEFKVRDVVQLKSGGESMTIIEIFEHENVRMAICKCLDGKQGAYPLESLAAVPPPTILPSSPWG